MRTTLFYEYCFSCYNNFYNHKKAFFFSKNDRYEKISQIVLFRISIFYFIITGIIYYLIFIIIVIIMNRLTSRTSLRPLVQPAARAATAARSVPFVFPLSVTVELPPPPPVFTSF